MTRISIFLSLFVLFATWTLAIESQERSPGIYLSMVKEECLKGEPIYIQVEKLGVRWDGKYYLDGEPCKQYGVPSVRHAPLVNPDGSPAVSEGPPEEYFLQDETLILDITHLCSWRMKDMKAGSHELCYKRDKGDLCVTFRVDEPQGVDAEAWKRISKNFPNVLDAVQAKKHITRDEILSHFPSSTYAVWVLLPYLGQPDAVEPSKILEWLNKGIYPRPNSIPDPGAEDGWRAVKKGRDMAEWQNKWIREILNNHPDFVYALRLKLTLAINNIVLGDAREGKKILWDLAKGTDKEINGWAQEFLQLIETKETPTKQKLLYSTD